MANRLITTNWTKPGVYVGQLFKPKLSADSSFRRIPCYIGVGPSNNLHQGVAVTRGYVDGEVLSFTTVAPFRASLNYIARGTKSDSKLVTSKGEEVDTRTWNFIEDNAGRYVGVEISSAAFDQDETYVIDYQGADPRILDRTGIDDIERLLQVGMRPDGNNFSSNDFILETAIGQFVEGSPLIYGTDSNTGSGDLPQVTSGSKYVGPSRLYSIAIDAQATVASPYIISHAVPGGTNVGTGDVTFDVTNWAGTADTTYAFTVESIAADGSEMVLGWSRDVPSASGQVTVRAGFESSVPFVDGLILRSNAINFHQAGDGYEVVVSLEDTTQLLVSWAAEDTNGGSGEFHVTKNNRTAVHWTAGMTLVFGSDLDAYAVGDTFTVECVSTGNLQWRYDLASVENVPVDELSFDQTGSITGQRRAYYVVLNVANISRVTAVEVIAADGASSNMGSSDFSLVEGTNYVVFATRPSGETLRIGYEYSNSPNFGQTYYVDAFAKKPDEEYNQVLFLNSGNYRKHVGYPAPTNMLGIMAELAIDVVGLDQIAVVQVKDSDRDGRYSNADYRVALQAARPVKAITDLIPLSRIEVVGDALYELEQRNDPFESSETLGWFGYPVNTPIGSPQLTPGTLLHYGGSALQLAAASKAHGCVISVANTWGKRTITGRAGNQTQITLDGSFIAGTLAAMVANFPNSWETLLRKTVPGFEEVQNFGDDELGRLGPRGFILLEQDGDVTRVLDAVTHDNSAPDYRQINAMTQKHYANNVIRERMDQAIISIVPVSQEDGEVLVASALIDILGDLAARGDIGKFQNADGSSRPIDRNRDVKVIRDDADPTRYFMSFQYFLRYGIHRVNGMFQVDRDTLFAS